MWKYTSCPSIVDRLNLTLHPHPFCLLLFGLFFILLHLLCNLFTKHSFIVHFPFPLFLPFFTSGHFSFCFLLSSASLVALMHSHQPFIHVDVLFIKASIIQPTPRHLRSLRSTSHSIIPPLPPTHGVSLEAWTLPATLLLSSLSLSPWRSHSYSCFGTLLWSPFFWKLMVQGM